MLTLTDEQKKALATSGLSDLDQVAILHLLALWQVITQINENEKAQFTREDMRDIHRDFDDLYRIIVARAGAFYLPWK